MLAGQQKKKKKKKKKKGVLLLLFSFLSWEMGGGQRCHEKRYFSRERVCFHESAENPVIGGKIKTGDYLYRVRSSYT